MTLQKDFRCSLGQTILTLLLACLVFGLAEASAQPKYRTFSQSSLAEKKAKAGKPLAGEVCFTFYNPTGDTVDGLVARCNAHILSVDDSGGFTSVTISAKGKTITATGLGILPGDSATICMTVDKKSPGAKISGWYWTDTGIQEGQTHGDLFPTSENRLYVQPNGGSMLEYIYKRIVVRPQGIVLGLPRPDSALSFGWIRYMKADRKYFPHTGEPRCLDFIVAGSGNQKPFVKELKNPHVKKHDNHLLGELHALKLAIVANDSGVTEPLDSLSTLLGDLLYNDGANLSDPFNAMTVRQIDYLADSSLTYCGHFDSAAHASLDAALVRINAAFDGPYAAVSFLPFVLGGTHTLADAGFLHPNPSVLPVSRSTPPYAIADAAPDAFALAQNYPNPFNPTTTIDFSLPEASLVTLAVYNMLGQEVASLLRQMELEGGDQSVVFDASALSSGIYLYRISTQPLEKGGSRTLHQVKRMLLVK